MHPELLDRRNFLTHAGSGLGGVALASLLARDGLLAAELERVSGYRIDIDPAAPHAARPAPAVARAKNVLVLFCSGALSHMDTFDWKPELVRRDGQAMPDGEAKVTFQGENGAIA